MTHEKTTMLAKMGLLAAISIGLILIIQIPFPPLPFLKYDAADIPILLATFAFGPVAGLCVLFVVSALQAFLLAGDGIIGFFMHMAATGGFVLVAGNIYRLKKTKKNALFALLLGVLTMVVTMALWNILVTPIYMGIPRMALIKTYLPLIVLFNVLKAGINAAITFIIYKPLSPLLHPKH